jgi:hypothetical protein
MVQVLVSLQSGADPGRHPSCESHRSTPSQKRRSGSAYRQGRIDTDEARGCTNRRYSRDGRRIGHSRDRVPPVPAHPHRLFRQAPTKHLPPRSKRPRHRSGPQKGSLHCRCHIRSSSFASPRRGERAQRTDAWSRDYYLARQALAVTSAPNHDSRGATWFSRGKPHAPVAEESVVWQNAPCSAERR